MISIGSCCIELLCKLHGWKCIDLERRVLHIFANSLHVVIVFKLWCRKELLAELQEQQISAQKVLFNLSGEKDRTARLAGLVPVMQQWHKKKVENLLLHDWNIWPFCSARSWDILPTVLLAGSLRHTRHSCLYGDLLSVQAGELCIMDDNASFGGALSFFLDLHIYLGEQGSAAFLWLLGSDDADSHRWSPVSAWGDHDPAEHLHGRHDWG